MVAVVASIYVAVTLTWWFSCWLLVGDDWGNPWEPFLTGLVWPITLPIVAIFKWRRWGGFTL